MDRVRSSDILPNGLLPNVSSSVTRVLDGDRWSLAEERIAELIYCIQPNSPSEERRNAVANYVERLIMNCISCQVFKFGSVPLKTYLPDGDIDLTACSGNESLKDSWANAVRDMLEKEEKSETAEFRVKEVQYIQAEVKLIKCLVENIVVDISFNQVGGLCTLCFLEEMDKLINQNHLFKRSIILIKAWCYYESRILGAHHGLISTYALETLVLYIFHVFNNSFAGPLEVLYRFLEFFSNFDWDNFCLSLWGPIRISSLPDMTAEPPRKDSGKLLLTKGYLDERSQLYAVIPGGQESHSQPFISKHFNVVDPLRTNNNLGRSVSKGNFYRIRSAFAFGARRLSRLFECPKEEIIAEVNQFFMNTWERHGSRNRPDVPNMSLWHSQPSKTIPVEVKNLQAKTVLQKKNDNIGLPLVNEPANINQNSTSEAYTNINLNSHTIHKSDNPSTVSRTQNQKIYSKQTSSRIPDQVERNNSSSGSVQSDKSQRTSKPNHSLNDLDLSGQIRFQFARTRSSPELTETSFDLSRGRRARATDSSQLQNPAARLEYGRRKNSGSEVTGSHSSKSSLDDPMSMQQIPSQKSIEVNSASQSSSNNYHNDVGFGIMGDDLASLSEALEMQQEEQDMVNMMNSNMHRFHGPVQYPPFSHIPVKFSPLPASTGFSHRNFAGIFPSNLSMIGHSWGPAMQLPPGLGSSPVSHYYPVMNLSSNQNDLVDSVNDSSPTTEVNTEDVDHMTRYERGHEAGTSRGLNSISSGTRMLHLDDKTHKSHGDGNFNSSRGSSAPLRSFNRIREDNGLATENHRDSFHNQASESDNYSSLRATQSSSPISQAGSRSKLAPEILREGYAPKHSKPGRGTKWGRKPASSSTFDPSYDKRNNGLQCESSSDHVPSEVEDEATDWTMSMGTEMSDRISGSGALAFQHLKTLQTSSFDPVAQRNASDPLIPFPMLMNATRQRGTDNSKALPVAFFPTGPPVPFYFYPIPFRSDTGNPDGSEKQFDLEESNYHEEGTSDQIIDSKEGVDHSNAHPSSNSSLSVVPESSGGNSDILNSDYDSHLENLKYVRSCQNMQYNGQLIYSSPVVMPPVYLQSHQPWDGSGRPIMPNLNYSPMVGYGSGLVPLLPYPQPSADRASAGFQHFGDEAPRYRGGTGTYLPIPKNNSFRERQSGSRNHRGNYYDRNNHGDREGSWISSKQRTNHNHGRNQTERTSSRPDRLLAAENQSDRVRESQRHGSVSSYLVQNSSLGSANSSHGSANMVGVYPQVALSSNGIEPSGLSMPPVIVVYPYDQSVGYASSAEQLELSSLGGDHRINGNEASQISDAVPVRGLYKPRHSTYRGGSRSTDQSS